MSDEKPPQPAARQADALERLAVASDEHLAHLRRQESRRRRAEQTPDRVRRREPRRLGLGAMFMGVPGLAAQFAKQVPGEYWAQSDHREVTVSCPCGADAVVPEGSPTECACDRFFLFTGVSVRVARYEDWKAEPEEKTEVES